LLLSEKFDGWIFTLNFNARFHGINFTIFPKNILFIGKCQKSYFYVNILSSIPTDDGSHQAIPIKAIKPRIKKLGMARPKTLIIYHFKELEMKRKLQMSGSSFSPIRGV
jgi:hypothetical protein